MSETIAMLVLSIVCWYFALNKRVREEHSRPAKYFFRLRKDHQDMLEASGFAAALVGALFFSVIFIFLLVMRLAN